MAQDLEAPQGNPLVGLLSREWPKEMSVVEEEEHKYLLHQVELARGLVDSEYWDLLRVCLIGDLEEAKGALERIETSDRDIRVNQGKANALEQLHNFILRLSRYGDEDGKARD